MQVSCKITLSGDKNYAKHFIGAAKSQLRILENQMTFQNLKQGARRVRFNSRAIMEAIICFNLKEVKIHCLPAIIKGVGREFEQLPKTYIYVTISDYVTIWDPLTGEIAEDICNNYGQVHDESGNPLVTFPCHKDDLVKWLEGIPDKPTRQVLKDNPEGYRDYLDDNGLDIGEENRIETAYYEDPSYNCYYGIESSATFTNTVQTTGDTCVPLTCVLPCELCLDSCTQFTKNKIDTPSDGSIVGDPEKCKDSFICNTLTDQNYDVYSTINPMLGIRYKGWRRTLQTASYVQYLQTYFSKSKHLYLCTYPSPTYSPILSEAEIEYCCPETTRYEEPVDFDVDRTYFDCDHDILIPPGFYLSQSEKTGNSFSIKTLMGDMVLDCTPIRKWNENNGMLQQTMSDAAMDEGCYTTHLPVGICNSLYKIEVPLPWWESSPYFRPEHATDTCAWCKREDQDLMDDVAASENTRTGVSWCGSRFDYRAPSEPQTPGWYRVLLRFYMGKFFTTGYESLFSSGASCPDPAQCAASPDCTGIEWSNRSIERLSSVQATIELEKPGDYPKERNILKYQRPDDFQNHPEDFVSLCAFPGRDCGYPEGEFIYPFDGTYVLHTLGEAVEELINGHYEDGSNDKLLVYLYERPEEIEEEK